MQVLPTKKTLGLKSELESPSGPALESKPSGDLLRPEIPRQNLLDAVSSRRSTNPITALVQRIQDSPSATAVVLGSMGAATLMSFAPREAVALTSPDLQQPELPELLLANEHAPGDEDENVKELKDKVGALVDRKFGGSLEAAFKHYDRNGDKGVDRKELLDLLSDAKVGNLVTRGFWADGVLKRIDREVGNRDGRIQWSEFQSVLATVT